MESPQKSVSARNALVTSNLGLVRKVAAALRVPTDSANYPDLLQVGAEAMIYAAESFDPGKGKFSSFAWVVCYRAMRDALCVLQAVSEPTKAIRQRAARGEKAHRATIEVDETALGVYDPDADEQIDAKSHRAALYEAIGTLPELQQDLIHAHLRGVMLKDWAPRNGLPPQRASEILSLALESLKSALVASGHAQCPEDLE